MVKVNAMSYALLIKELMAGEYTCEELAERTGLHYVTVLNHVRELRKAKAAYICAWRMNDRKHYVLRIYCIGDQSDARKPRAALTTNERTYRYRMKRAKALSNTSDAVPAVQP